MHFEKTQQDMNKETNLRLFIVQCDKLLHLLLHFFKLCDKFVNCLLLAFTLSWQLLCFLSKFVSIIFRALKQKYDFKITKQFQYRLGRF